MTVVPPPSSTWRRRAFLLVALLIPVAIVAAVEGALRAAGVGRPTSFFLRDGDRYVSNPRFGWRFFPVALARTPLPIVFPARKPSGTNRVFVFGESAAMGIPDPAFGFSREVEVLLEAWHPGLDVEMINTAMTAISSHVVAEIARECAWYEPDAFVVYMGNNEVVGPFGAGTIFTDGAPPYPLVRARLIAQRTRIGQLFERGVASMAPRPAHAAGWRGMEMLTEQQIPADDPRLFRTYESVRRNLEAILDAARSAGVPVVVTTVPVNLRDNPPFASLHTRDANDADMQYRLGVAALEAGRRDEGAQSLARARDLDLLRFRADSRINETIRRIALQRVHDSVLLVDAERLFASARGGAPGDDVFWEHVHLNEIGNDLIARPIATTLEAMIAHRNGRDPAVQFVPPEEVAKRLALTDWDRHRMAAAILEMMRRPPFTSQAGHDARLERRRREVGAARSVARAGLDKAEATYRAAIARRPNDPLLRVNFATLLRERGKFGEAAAEWRAALQAVPGVVEWRSRLAFAVADEAAATHPPDGAKLAEAEQLLREIARDEPELPAAHVNLGNVLERAGRAADAEAEYREALRLNPGHDVARLNLAALLLARGSPDEAEAERLYREAIESDPQAAEAHARLAGILEKRQRQDEALDEYRRALQLDPDLAWARNNFGYALERRGDADEALRQYRAAVETDPEYTLARLNLADLLLRRGEPKEAALEFERVLEQARTRGDGRLAAGMEEQLRRLRAR